MDELEKVEPDYKHPPSIIVRWEAILSILTFALCTALQQGIVPEGTPTKVVFWLIGLIGQIGIIFGRPLLIRGVRQDVTIEKRERK